MRILQLSTWYETSVFFSFFKMDFQRKLKAAIENCDGDVDRMFEALQIPDGSDDEDESDNDDCMLHNNNST